MKRFPTPLLTFVQHAIRSLSVCTYVRGSCVNTLLERYVCRTVTSAGFSAPCHILCVFSAAVVPKNQLGVSRTTSKNQTLATLRAVHGAPTRLLKNCVFSSLLEVEYEIRQRIVEANMCAESAISLWFDWVQECGPDQFPAQVLKQRSGSTQQVFSVLERMCVQCVHSAVERVVGDKRERLTLTESWQNLARLSEIVLRKFLTRGE
jgi:hypothetical protein